MARRTLLSPNMHPALFWSLLCVSAVLTCLGVSGVDKTGFFLNLSAESWGSFATVVLIDNVLRRQRQREQAPMLRLAMAECHALVLACKGLVPGHFTAVWPPDLRESEAALAALTPDEFRALAVGLGHIADSVDNLTARFSHYLPDLELATLLKLRHTAKLAQANLGAEPNRVAKELVRVGVVAARLRDQLSGSATAPAAPEEE